MQEPISPTLVSDIAETLSYAIFKELDVRHGNMELIPVARKMAEILRDHFYNEAVAEVRKVLDARFADLQMDLDMLERS